MLGGTGLNMTIGLKQGTVRLEAYTPSWTRRFAAEKRRLAHYLPARGVHLEHIGSTAVPGLAAKPIIDIAIAIPSFKRLTATTKALVRSGYTYKGEYGLSGRHFFTLGDPVTIHLHLVEPTSEHWVKWLAFRDYLITWPKEAARYDRFKHTLARRFANNRDGYTKAKSPFIDAMLAKALKKDKIPPEAS